MIYLADLLGFGCRFYDTLGLSADGAFLLLSVTLLFCAAAGYLIGSLNFAVIISKKMFGQDVREYGSHNAGFTNMKRVYGWRPALYTMAGDVGKQAVAILIGITVGAVPVMGAYVAGMFCMIGHVAPCYFGFRGGKGVLTAATLILLLDPLTFIIVFAMFALTLLLTRYVSLASMVGAFIYPAVTYYRYAGKNPFAVLFAVFVGLFIIFTHRSNIKRLFNNQESKFTFKNSEKEDK